MHDLEVKRFLDGINFIEENSYIDAIEEFTKLTNEFSDSDLVDDAQYNIALCYFEINQFEKAIEILESLIANYPDATLTVLGAGNEFGRTAAKAYYLMMNCYLALGKSKKANEILPKIEKYSDSYIIESERKILFFELAKKSLDIYNSIS